MRDRGLLRPGFRVFCDRECNPLLSDACPHCGPPSGSTILAAPPQGLRLCQNCSGQLSPSPCQPLPRSALLDRLIGIQQRILHEGNLQPEFRGSIVAEKAAAADVNFRH